MATSKFFKGIYETHQKLHEHVFHRRTSSEPGADSRTGEPLDLTIKFIQASGLPRMDVGPGALSDPYFIANIDGKIDYVSTAQKNTLNPVWNESWMIKNVPSDAKLRVDVYDKDEGSLNDDYMGSFKLDLTSGMHVETVKGILNADRGTFGLQITAESSLSTTLPQYTFDGPVRYTRHFSPTVGRLANPNSPKLRLWSTWKINIKGVHTFFGDNHQHWNVHYKAAQTIFQPGPLSFSVRTTIQAGHRLLYARTTTNSFGLLQNAKEFWDLFMAGDDRPPVDRLERERWERGEGSNQRVKPAVYTYIIAEDNTFRFSETGAAFFVDFASKHALHSCCAETVRYSGEFHPRPVFPDKSGWSSFSESTPDQAVDWELVIDNNSGTYSPDKALLHALKALLEYNFPGLRVVVLDYKQNDEELKRSTEATRAYALKWRRGTGVEGEAVTPGVVGGEGETLAHMAEMEKPAEGMKEEPPVVPAERSALTAAPASSRWTEPWRR